MNKKYKFLSIIPAIIIMCIIFYFSHQEAAESAKLSGGIVENIFSFITKLFKLELLGEDRTNLLSIFEIIVRKTAHMTEYAVLAIAISYSLYVYNKRGFNLILYSGVLTILYAITDEIHQIFIPGRAGMVTDVLIDGLGAILGSIVFYFISKRIENKNRRVHHI